MLRSRVLRARIFEARTRLGQSLVEFSLVAGVVAIIVVAAIWLWARSAGDAYQDRAASSTQSEGDFYKGMTQYAGDTHLTR